MSGAILEEIAARLEPKLASVFRRFVTDALTLEASVRRTRDGAFRGDRMIVEGAPAGLEVALAACLDVPVSVRFAHFRAAAHGLGLSCIAGWDGEKRTVKLYVNASDSSSAVRAGLANEVGLPGELEPHVVGVNASASGEELKYYSQYESEEGLPFTLSDIASALVERVRGKGLLSGLIVSNDFSLEARTVVPRTLFVGLREADPRDLEETLSSLPGWSVDELIRRLPFPPASPSFVGLSLAEPGSWTTYFKSQGSSAQYSLNPLGSFATSSGEVAIHSEPDRPGTRAYARVAGRALSYRLSQGQVSNEELERLFAWLTQSLERSGVLEGRPPQPWQLVSSKP